MLDQRGRLLVAALGFAGLPRPSYDRALWALRSWLDWGATEEQMRSAVSIERACVDLRPDQRWIADRSCPAIFDLAGIGVQAEYRFRAGRFTSVIVRFPSKDFERIAEIFSERYGEPTNRTTDHLAWVGRKASVALYRRVDKVPSVGFARVTTNEDMDESERLRHEQTKGGRVGPLMNDN